MRHGDLHQIAAAFRTADDTVLATMIVPNAVARPSRMNDRPIVRHPLQLQIFNVETLETFQNQITVMNDNPLGAVKVDINVNDLREGALSADRNPTSTERIGQQEMPNSLTIMEFRKSLHNDVSLRRSLKLVNDN